MNSFSCIFYIWSTSMLQVVSFYIANSKPFPLGIHVKTRDLTLSAPLIAILTLRITALYYRHTLLVRTLYCILALIWLSTLGTAIHTIYLMTRERITSWHEEQ
jgi:hypothetical protein